MVCVAWECPQQHAFLGLHDIRHRYIALLHECKALDRKPAVGILNLPDLYIVSRHDLLQSCPPKSEIPSAHNDSAVLKLTQRNISMHLSVWDGREISPIDPLQVNKIREGMRLHMIPGDARLNIAARAICHLLP